MNEPTPSHCGAISERDRMEIQGFVTSGFGHLAHAGYLFLRFDKPDAARAWLGEVRSGIITARSWRADPAAAKLRPAATVNLAFTAAGLRALGLSPDALESFPDEFLDGITKRSRQLGDIGASGPANWQFGGDPDQVHALAILMAASEKAIEEDAGRFAARLARDGAGEVIAAEFGHRPADDREPFGFRDGIAQPGILGIHKTGVRTGEFILGYENEYGYLPVTPVVRAESDPGNLLQTSRNPHRRGEHDLGRNGTFLVYRKLEQNVAGFWGFLRSESVRHHGSPDAGFMVWLAAKMVGRWPGGAPLTLSPENDDRELSRADEFLYRSLDGEGRRCPFGAHIRRTNPRDQLRPAGEAESLHMTARHRILRRGRPYGPPLFDASILNAAGDMAARRVLEGLSDDGRSRGLHFLCVNASIKSQFEFIQQAWMNNARSNGVSANPDPFSSCPMSAGSPGSMLVPGREGELDLRTAPMPGFVTVRAGAYLFMPSLAAIEYLAGDRGERR